MAILSAAVADFKPETVADKKIKREKDDLVLRLNPTHDIARELGKRKRSGQLLVGFALETNDEETNAEKKLEKKNFDFIVLNSLQVKDTEENGQLLAVGHYDGEKLEMAMYDEVKSSLVSIDGSDED